MVNPGMLRRLLMMQMQQRQPMRAPMPMQMPPQMQRPPAPQPAPQRAGFAMDQAGMLRQIMNMMQQKQQPQQQPQMIGAATPEQAAAAQFDAQLQAAGVEGAKDSTATSGNVFAGMPGFYQGMFDTSKRTSPFSGFYTPSQQSKSWL